MQAIPLLLNGQNLMLCAPTASGKTEAVIAPLIERHAPPDGQSSSPAILYLTPTKALVSDLAARLETPLDRLGLQLAIRTRDRNTLRAAQPPAVLLSTPESCDSLLATQARQFANLRAIVIDELHLFDGTPRGDQLRVLLNRLRHIRTYAYGSGDAPDARLQYAALSASLPQPEQAAARYFPAAPLVQIEGARPLHADQIQLSAVGAAEIAAYIATFRAHGWKKALAFCNSRIEVESYAAAIREHSAFAGAVFVHYSNIEPKRRQEIEQQFSTTPTAICFASSTLELGIDIGSIDVILLIGAPGSAASFIQRIGRGSRRQQLIRAACFYRTPLEKLIFEVLCNQPSLLSDTPSIPVFRPAVAVQQIFSLLRQSPTGAVRFAELDQVFAGLLSPDDITQIVAHLENLQYLRPGRSGEWRAGDKLTLLIAQQANPHNTLSLHSNIKGSDGRKIEIRDRNTQQTVARVDAQWLDRSVLTLEGRTVNVDWVDGDAMWVSTAANQSESERPFYRSARQVLSFELAQRLPTALNLSATATPLVPCDEGWLWFHWLGDRYGTVLYQLLRGAFPVRITSQPGLCLLFSEPPAALPAPWPQQEIERYLIDQYRRLETLLDAGPFQHLLPTALRKQAVIAQFDIARFQQVVTRLQLSVSAEVDTAIQARLRQLLAETFV